MRRSALLLNLVLVVGVVASVTPARAYEVAPTTGRTTIRILSKVAKRLGDVGVRAGVSKLDVSGGTFDFGPRAAGGGGTLVHSDRVGLPLPQKLRKVTSLTLHIPSTGARGKVTGTAGERRVTLARLDLRHYAPRKRRDGFSGVRLVLAGRVTRLLNRKFKKRVLRPGAPLAKVGVTRVTQPLSIRSGTTEMTLSPEAADLFRRAGASFAATGGAVGAGTSASPFVFAVDRQALEFVRLDPGLVHAGGVRIVAPPGKPIDGKASIDFSPLEIRQEGGLLQMTTEAGVPLFRLVASPLVAGATLSLSTTARFTRSASRSLAPALGLSAAALERLRVATVTTRADLAG